MATIFEKVGLLVSANVHDLVNRALRANSVAVLTEQIRRADENLDELGGTIDLVEADLRIERKKNSALAADVTRLTDDAKVFLGAGQEARAATLVKQKLVKESALIKSNAAITDMESELEKLRAAEAALGTKIEELKTTRDNVERALEIAKRKNRTVETIEDVTDILRDDGAAGIADWAERVATTADVRLERELGKHQDLLDPMADNAVAAELERMKAEMNSAGPEAAAATATTYKVTVETGK